VCSRTRRVHTTGTPAVSFVMYRRRTAVVRGVYFDERGRKVRGRLRADLFFSATFWTPTRASSERASMRRIRARDYGERVGREREKKLREKKRKERNVKRTKARWESGTNFAGPSSASHLLVRSKAASPLESARRTRFSLARSRRAIIRV